jgi:hypothetical protein
MSPRLEAGPAKVCIQPDLLIIYLKLDKGFGKISLQLISSLYILE